MEFVIAIAVFAAAVLGLFIIIRVVARTLFGHDRRLERDLGLEVLRSRLSRGEITRAEFEEAAGALGAPRAAGARDEAP